MPYAKNSDLPDSVRGALPGAAQDVFRAVYNSHKKDNPDASEEECMRVAWGAVKRGWEKRDGRWVKKDQVSTDEAPRDVVQFFDALVLDGPRRTADGYLAATATVARTGIQRYRGHEVGRPDLEWVRVYRPDAEVFHRDSLRTYAHRPVTNDHPPVPVTSDNWKKYAVGQTGDEIIRDGHRVQIPLVLMDSGVIRDYEHGKKQLSLGYTTDLRWEPGKTSDGEAYDAVQTEIRANHLAVVAAARGGPELKIGDTKEEKEHHMKTITVDGLPVQVEDRDAEIVLRTIDKLAKQAISDAETMAEMKKRHAAEIAACATKDAESKKLIEAKDAEIATMKKQLEDSAMTPQKLDALVKDRSAIVSQARKVLGDRLVVDGKTSNDIRRQVVDSVMSDAAKGWTDDQVAASFASITARSPAADSGRIDLDHVLRDGIQDHVTTVDRLYDERDKKLQDAWKTPAAA